jgi:hypothetical protein
MLRRSHAVTLASVGALLLCGGTAVFGVDAATLEKVRTITPTTPKEVQMAIALAAGPPVADGATVYVLGAQGYEVARQGTNGFSCIIERVPETTMAPMCYDAEGSATTLQVTLFLESEKAKGTAWKQIVNDINEGYKSGRFKAPQKPGVTYMLSAYNWVPDPKTKAPIHFPGHVMFYAPYAKAANVGTGPGAPDLTDPGEPDNMMVIVPAADAHNHGYR